MYVDSTLLKVPVAIEMSAVITSSRQTSLVQWVVMGAVVDTPSFVASACDVSSLLSIADTVVAPVVATTSLQWLSSQEVTVSMVVFISLFGVGSAVITPLVV